MIKKNGPSFAERFWSRVDRRGEDECWPWLGRVMSNGYGRTRIGRWDGVAEPRDTTAHRFAYELAVGPIPEGFHVDHVCHAKECRRGAACRHRRCCNPRHLKAVTPPENIRRSDHSRTGSSNRNARKTHCPKGHPYDAENTYVRPNGDRTCRECNRARQSGFLTRQRAYGPNRSR